VLLDNAAIYPQWRQIVVKHAVSSVQVRDARIVDAMRARGITHLVTFNQADFKRYTDIMVMTPQEVINTYPPPATP
jgi:predicted nucleic acid-binding protein